MSQRKAVPASGPLLDWPPEIRHRYAPAFERLHRELGNHPNVLWLEQQLVIECEEARAVRGQDQYAAMRRQDRDALVSAKAFVEAARGIATYMRDFPHAGAFIGAGALLALKESGHSIAFRAGTPLAEAIAQFADQLAASAEAYNPVGRGPWAWRFCIPGAMYKTAIDDRRKNRRGPPEIATVLAFHLVIWLRKVTGPPFVVCAGISMPSTGRPHYGIAAAFVTAALGHENIDIRERLRANPGLRYLGWRQAG